MTTPINSDTSKAVKDEILQILMEYEGDVDTAMHPFIDFILAKDRYTKGVDAILSEWMKPVTDEHYVQISFELTELDPELKYNQNNIHPLFK